MVIVVVVGWGHNDDYDRVGEDKNLKWTFSHATERQQGRCGRKADKGERQCEAILLWVIFFLFGGNSFWLGGILKVHLAPTTQSQEVVRCTSMIWFHMTMTLICQSATLGLYFKSIWNRRRKWSNQGDDWKSRTAQFKWRCNCLILLLHLNRFFVVLYHIHYHWLSSFLSSFKIFSGDCQCENKQYYYWLSSACRLNI